MFRKRTSVGKRLPATSRAPSRRLVSGQRRRLGAPTRPSARPRRLSPRQRQHHGAADETPRPTKPLQRCARPPPSASSPRRNRLRGAVPKLACPRPSRCLRAPRESLLPCLHPRRHSRASGSRVQSLPPAEPTTRRSPPTCPLQRRARPGCPRPSRCQRVGHVKRPPSRPGRPHLHLHHLASPRLWPAMLRPPRCRCPRRVDASRRPPSPRVCPA